jgi:RNA recognition motif-containing protein
VQFGPIADSVVMRDRLTQAPRGFGFVTYASPQTAQSVALLEHVVDGKKVDTKLAVPRADDLAKPPLQPPLSPPLVALPSPPPDFNTRKVFIGGLSHATTEAELHVYFSRWGTVIDSVVMVDQHTRKPRGFGFVTYENAACADELCSSPASHELGGKHVDVKRAIVQQGKPGAVSPSSPPDVTIPRHAGLDARLHALPLATRLDGPWAARARPRAPNRGSGTRNVEHRASPRARR